MYRMRNEQTYFTITGLYSYMPNLFDDLKLPDSLNKNTCISIIIRVCGLLECAYPDGEVMKNIIKYWSFARSPDWQKMIEALEAEYNPIHNYDRTEDISNSENIKSISNNTVVNEKAGTLHTDDDLTHTNNLIDKETVDITNTRTDNLAEVHGGGETTEHYNTAYNAGLSVTAKDVLLKNGERVDNTGTQTNKEGGTRTNNHTGTYTDERDINTNHQETFEETGKNDTTDTRKGSTSIYARGNIGVTSTQRLIEQEIEIRYKFNIYEIIANEFKEKFCNLIYIL